MPSKLITWVPSCKAHLGTRYCEALVTSLSCAGCRTPVQLLLDLVNEKDPGAFDQNKQPAKNPRSWPQPCRYQFQHRVHCHASVIAVLSFLINASILFAEGLKRRRLVSSFTSERECLEQRGNTVKKLSRSRQDHSSLTDSKMPLYFPDSSLPQETRVTSDQARSAL